MKSRKNRALRRRRRLQDQRRAAQIQYDNLEPRCLLATDVGLAFTGSTFQTDSSYYPPDANGDIGPNHMIEVLNGRLNMIDKATGVRVQSHTMTGFFDAAGATVFNDPINPKVVYDRMTDHWFVAANGTGTGNWIYLAFSDTSDPTGTWQQLQFVGDSTGTHFNDEVNLAVDADAVYLTTNNTGPGGIQNISIYSIPKSDIFSPDPTLTNMSRFELLNPAVYGTSVKVASNFEASDGQAIALGSNGPSGVIFTPIMDTATPAAVLGTPTTVVTDLDGEYGAAVPAEQLPDVITEDDLWLETSDELTSRVVEIGGSVWGAKTISMTEEGVIDWFELDATTGDVIQSGEIAAPGEHVFNPSIAVNKWGIVALSYNKSNVGSPVGAFTTVGITVQGLGERNTQMEPIFQMEPGLSSYNVLGDTPFVSPWGETSSVEFDPVSVNEFFAVAPWANTVDRWSTHNAYFMPVDMEPVIDGNELDNTIIVRRNAADTSLLEVEFDGTVTDILPYEVLGRVVLRGLGGADRFIVDYSNGDPMPERGFLFDGGAGPDVVQVDNDVENMFHVEGATGHGTLNEISEFANVEELWGGTAGDHFLVEGHIFGSLVGREGDDMFEFAGTGTIGDSVNGDEGINTLSFLNRKNTVDPPNIPPPLPTEAELLAVSANLGFNGKTIGGPVGGDETTDQFRDISRLIGSQTELDILHGLDEISTWTIDEANSAYDAAGRTLGIEFWDTYYASSFDDTFNVLSNTLNPLRMFGLDGNDTYNFSSDAPANMGSVENIGGLIYAMGGAGANQLNVSNAAGTATESLVLSKRISGMGEIVFDATPDGGTFDVDIVGSGEADTFLLHSFIAANTMQVHSMGGNDTFDIQDLSKAQVDVFGGDGDDLYLIEMVQGVSFRNLDIQDSLNAEADRVSLRGTILDEVFNLNPTSFTDTEVTYSGIEQFGALGRGGNDTFNVTGFDFPLFIEGEEGDDVINISSDAPLNMGNVAGFTDPITIDAGPGFNQLVISNYMGAPTPGVQVFDDRIEGLLPVPVYYAATGGRFAHLNGSLGGIHLIGSDLGSDTFDVKMLDGLNTLKLDGKSGVDRFHVRDTVAGSVMMDGGEDADQYNYFMSGSGNRVGRIMDTGTVGNNRASIYGTNDADTFLVTDDSVARGGEVVRIDSTLGFMQIVGRDGFDSFTMNNTPALVNYLLGQVGNDSFTINGTVGASGIRMVGDAGADQFTINNSLASTFTRVVGGFGTDSLSVMDGAMGDVSSDLGEGSDTYMGYFHGSGSRWFGALDSGATGMDVAHAIGTTGDDMMELRSANIYRMAERMAVGSNMEEVNIDSSEGNDNVAVYASFTPDNNIMLGAGDDILTMFSTTFATNIHAMGGEGNDRMEAKKVHQVSTVWMHGEDDDDLFVVGSDSVADNGNLNQIRGPVYLDGGASVAGDSLEANDAAIMGAYGYEISPTQIVTHPGRFNVARPNFAGIFYDGTLENLRLDGTQAANTFVITASPDTYYYLDGSDPFGTSFGDQVVLNAKFNDGHAFRWTNRALGEGHWTFTNGDQTVEFENMEQAVNPPPPSPIIAWPGGPSDDGDSDQPNWGESRLAGGGEDDDELDSIGRRLNLDSWFDDSDFATVDDILSDAGDSIWIDEVTEVKV